MSALHMHRLSIEASKMLEYGRRLGLPLRSVDDGYLAHCHLKGLFGEHAPKPFYLEGQSGRFVRVLGYASVDADALREHAQTYADPFLFDAVDWAHFASKPMPTSWEVGQRLGFQVRVCPVRRLARGSGRPGAEVDAFLAHCTKERIEQGADRAAVYMDWLRERLAALGGVDLVQAQLAGFSRERLVRRRQGEERRAAVSERPDATFRGELEVTDPRAFSRLLARGVGRHRAFGFGMLLLRALG